MTRLSKPPATDVLAGINRLAGYLGYPTPLPFLINIAPVDFNLDTNGTIAKHTYFSGDIHIGQEAKIEREVLLRGDIDVGHCAKVGRATELHGDIDVGRYSRLNGANYARHRVSVGQFCAIAPQVTFQAGDHDMTHWAVQTRFQTELFGESPPIKTEKIEVGSDVWIGRDAIILSGVTVGHGACIGAKSVVTEDVEPFEIVTGTPAEHLGWRFNEQTRKELLELCWWDWDLEEIVRKADKIKEVVNQSIQ